MSFTILNQFLNQLASSKHYVFDIYRMGSVDQVGINVTCLIPGFAMLRLVTQLTLAEKLILAIEMGVDNSSVSADVNILI